MSFLDEFGITADQISEPTFERKQPALGYHAFEIGESVVRKGTKNKPNDVFFLIEYQLSDADGNPTGAHSEWSTMKENGVVTEKAEQSLGWLDVRIKSLGFDGGLNDPEFKPDALIGLRGRLEIAASKNPKYVQIRNLSLDESADDSESNEFEAPAKATKPARSAKAEEAAEAAELFG